MTQHTAETVARIRAKVAEGYMPAVDDVQVLLDEHDRLAAQGDAETVLRALLDEVGTRRDGIARRLAAMDAPSRNFRAERVNGKDEGLEVAEALIRRALAALRAHEVDEVDENEDDVDLDYGYAQGDSERA